MRSFLDYERRMAGSHQDDDNPIIIMILELPWFSYRLGILMMNNNRILHESNSRTKAYSPVCSLLFLGVITFCQLASTMIDHQVSFKREKDDWKKVVYVANKLPFFLLTSSRKQETLLAKWETVEWHQSFLSPRLLAIPQKRKN